MAATLLLVRQTPGVSQPAEQPPVVAGPAPDVKLPHSGKKCGFVHYHDGSDVSKL